MASEGKKLLRVKFEEVCFFLSPSLCKNVLVCVCVRACHEYIDVFNIRAGLSGGGRGLHQNPYPPDFIACIIHGTVSCAFGINKALTFHDVLHRRSQGSRRDGG